MLDHLFKQTKYDCPKCYFRTMYRLNDMLICDCGHYEIYRSPVSVTLVPINENIKVYLDLNRK